MENNKYKKLVKNTAVLTIGSFGSKLLSFFTVALYTRVLTTQEYGQIDLFLTASGLIIPFLTLKLEEAVIRFIVAKEIDEKVVLNNAFLIFVIGAIVSLAQIPLYRFILRSDRYSNCFAVYLIILSFNSVFGQYLRVIGKNLAYSLNGLVLVSINIILNLVFLLYYKLGVFGYLLSMIIATLISDIYIIFNGRLTQSFSFHSIELKTLKIMLRYTIPLIPNSLMWWIMNAGDKYIINYYLGDASNGIYSAAMKIPTIINMFYSIFISAWQISSIEEMDSNEITKYYENVFKSISMILTIGASGIIVIIKPLYELLMGNDFVISWKYVPLLTIAMVISCYSSFFGVTYTTYKMSKRVFTTTLFGAVFNLAFNYILVQSYGLYGVAIGTIIGYLVVAIIRIFDTKRIVGAKIDIFKNVISFVLLIIISYISTSIDSSIIYYLATTAGLFGIILIFLSDFRHVFGVITNMIAYRKDK